ncbi:hypothetical protein M0812_21908 [Anaeramoeba flamelloides]|uniref:UFSP1/2/DUB catalytic domain-containing protein n=1 Tax=Anaeramoeba flamelloides TaxID=1746091 RepID=A0AAV7YYJ5_9EUKA|nr:hypothetical protein M0812_21908 [Anaeramoeba flamelloides]
MTTQLESFTNCHKNPIKITTEFVSSFVNFQDNIFKQPTVNYLCSNQNLHHYYYENKDSGWGCLYRTIQTVSSELYTFGKSKDNEFMIPKIKEMQKYFDSSEKLSNLILSDQRCVSDKQERLKVISQQSDMVIQVGSSTWFEPWHAKFFFLSRLGAEFRLMCYKAHNKVSNGRSRKTSDLEFEHLVGFQNLVQLLCSHFKKQENQEKKELQNKEQQTVAPIILDNSISAFTLLGIRVNPETEDCCMWISDPHVMMEPQIYGLYYMVYDKEGKMISSSLENTCFSSSDFFNNEWMLLIPDKLD